MARKYAAGSREGVGGRPRGAPTKVVRIPLAVANLARGLGDRRWRAGDINEFLDVGPRTSAAIPLVSSVAACGFPSPADDYLDQVLDFNELLIHNPAATFAVRIQGESMIRAGLLPGDIAIVDRSITPAGGCIILALIDGEFTIKRYCPSGAGIVLRAENPAFADITISPEIGIEVWGVVTGSMRRY